MKELLIGSYLGGGISLYRKIMSFLVIVSTGLSVFTMLYSTYPLKETIFNTNKEKTEISAEQNNLVTEESKKSNSYSDNKDKDSENSVNNKDENYQENKKESQKESSKDKQIVKKSKDIEKPPLKEESISSVSEDKLKEEVSEDKIKESEVKNKNSCPVFSVQKENIPDKLTINEKGKLFRISNKLSAIDYGKLMEYINQDDDEKAVRDSLRLLKTRLSKKDYEEIKNIMKRFVNNIEEFEKINS